MQLILLVKAQERFLVKLYGGGVAVVLRNAAETSVASSVQIDVFGHQNFSECIDFTSTPGAWHPAPVMLGACV